MFDMTKIGEKLSTARRAKDMTQTELADALGISFQAVSNWERGNSMPDIAKLPEIAGVRPTTEYKQTASENLIYRMLCEICEVKTDG